MFIQVEDARCKQKPPRKKGKFAISINEQGRSKYYVKKFRYFLKENYSFLSEKHGFNRAKALRNAKAGDFIVFGVGKKHDYSVMTSETFLDDPRISDKIEVIDLEAGFKLVKKAVRRYTEKNYPWKVPTKIVTKPQKKCAYIPACSQATYLTSTRPVVARKVVTTTPCRPVRVVRAPRPERDWDVQVNNTYVLLTKNGEYATRKITKYGNRETVSIDGVRYTVRRDHVGNGILI